MLKASAVFSVGILAGDVAGEALMPLAWLLAALATVILAWAAREKMLLGSFLLWLTIAYLGAFSMSCRIASDGPRQPYHRAEPTTIQKTVNEVREPLMCDLRERLAETGMTDDAISIMTAMTVAEKSGIDRSMREMFSVAGASHVLALSGLHVGIIALMLGLLLGGRHRRLTEIVIITVIWGYVLISGLPVSAVRAAIMLTVWGIISLSRRQQHSMNVLGTAMLLMLLINPATLFDVGFQLSCSAVFFLLLCMPFLMEHCPWNHKAGVWLWGLFATSFVAQMATSPLVAFYFGRFSAYSLLSNVVVVPLTPVVIIIGMLTMLSLLLPFGWLVTAVVWIENFTVDILLTSVRGVAALPGASIEGIDISVLQVIMLYVLLLCMIAIVRKMTFRMDFAQNLS